MLRIKLNTASSLNSPSISIEKAFDVTLLLSTTDKFKLPSFPTIDTSL